MSPGFAAAVCEGFYGSLEELLSRDLPNPTRKTLLELREHTSLAIDALNAQCGAVCESEEVRQRSLNHVSSPTMKCRSAS